MKYRLISIGIVFLIVTTGFLGFITFESNVVRAGTTIYVPTDYPKIQDAINASKDGDTVYVYSGTYYEHVVVNKTINLTGEDRENTIIDGGGSGDVVQITVDWVNVSGFTITNIGLFTDGEGLRIISDNNSISGNNMINNSNGIYLTQSCNNNTITDNKVISNSMNGILLDIDCNFNIITNNTLSNNSDGIMLSYSSYNIIVNNDISYNRYGIHLEYSEGNTLVNNSMLQCGIHISGADPNVWNTHSIDTSNTVNGKPVFYWKNQNSGTIPPGAGQVILANCNNVKIENQNVSNGSVGIQLGFSNNNYIANNTAFLNNMYGINLYFSDYNTLTNNTAFSNGANGFFLYHSSNNTLTNNNMSYNDNGIVCNQICNYNTIINNDVFSNSYVGLKLGYSIGNSVKYNTFSFHFFRAITLTSANSNNIIGNKVSNNDYGIRLWSSNSENYIFDNLVSNNTWGIYVRNSPNNHIYHNNIINNSNQSYDNRNDNFWDDGYPSGGNYWSDFDESSEGAYDDYNGPDQDVLGGDGKVDKGTIGGGGKNPYIIDSDSRDNYPLIEPTKNFMILKQGWNLISLPLIQEEQNLIKVLESIDGLYDAVQWYNITDKNDLWKHYKVGKPYGNDLFEINETMGFWIHITQPGDTIFFYNGKRFTENQTITLYPGWNMVGYPSLSNRDRTTALNNIDFPNDVDAILTYNSRVQRWEKMGPSDYFEVGKGYYVHATSDCVWDVPI
ncbi:MAG: right-handed parallel beta-helix repeat-containing protein [Thermoplasmata archaeon]|nr:MAG: right-handed parallel beta-helix repeat-containing protein [Thermoplasmata archaeon]